MIAIEIPGLRLVSEGNARENHFAKAKRVREQKQIVAAFENWWDKYRVTLTEIEGRRDEATKALQGFLKGLGYV